MLWFNTVDPGSATGSSTPLLCWENPSMMNSKITLSIFLTVARYLPLTLFLFLLVDMNCILNLTF